MEKVVDEGAGAAVLEAPAPPTRKRNRPLPQPDSAAKHWLLASVVWLTVVDLFGLVLATQFVTPQAFGDTSWLAFSRIRHPALQGWGTRAGEARQTHGRRNL